MFIEWYGGFVLEKWFNRVEKKEVWFIVLPLILVIPLLSFSHQLYDVFQGDIYSNLELVIRVLIIAFTMAIAIQSYLVFSHLLSNQTLYIGNMFFVVSLLELAGLFSSQNQSLHIILRLFLSFGFLFLILHPRKQMTLNYRKFSYASSLLFVIGSIFLVYMTADIMTGQLLDLIDNIVHLLAIIFQILTIVIISRYIKNTEAIHVAD